MAAVTICSDFGVPKVKSDTVSTVSPSISHEVMGPDAMILVFWMLSFKFSKPGFSSMWTINFQMFKLDLEKTEEPDIKLPTSVGSWKKQESSRKRKSISALLTMPKPLTVWIIINCGKCWKRGIPDHLTCLLRNLCTGQETTVKTGYGTTDWFQIRKGVHQGWILSPCSYNVYAEYIMENAGLGNHTLESRLPGEISVTSVTLMTPPLWQKTKKN